MSPSDFYYPIIRDVLPQDIDSVRPILESWMRDPETGNVMDQEVDSTLAAIDATAHGTLGRIYEVAEGAGGVILGIMGVTDASKTLAAASPAVERGNAAELINAFVNPTNRRRGIGKLLVRDLEYRAKELAFEDILVTSGPRYSETGWPFWQSVYGDPVMTVQDAYGSGLHAPVWRKRIARW